MYDTVGGSTGRRQRKASEVTTLQRFVQVQPERFEHYTRVSAELEVTQHADDVCAVVGVGSRQQVQQADFVVRLAPKPILASNDLQRHPATRLVVERAHHLTETAATEYFEYFIPARSTSLMSFNPLLPLCVQL